MLTITFIDGLGNNVRTQWPDEFTAKVEVVRDGNMSCMNQIVRNADGLQVLSIPAGLVVHLYRG